MDTEPKALRPYILLSTTFVVVGVSAAYGVWHLAATRSASEALLPAAASEGAPRPVDFLTETSPGDRTRLTALVDSLAAGDGSLAREAEERDLLLRGRAAVPPLLTALDRAFSGPDAQGPEAQRKVERIDRVLGRVRARLAEGYVPEPWPATADRATIDRRVRSWFAWWATVPAGGG